MNPSIRNRLLSTTTAVLIAFLALTGWVLDRAYRNSVYTSAEEQLRLVIYSVMGVVEDDQGRLIVGDGLSEPRLSLPDSGLYALFQDDLSGVLWSSLSLSTTDVSLADVSVEAGAFQFARIDAPVPRFQLSYPVIWEGADSERVTFIALSDQAPFNASIASFRRSLGVGYALAMLFFVLAQVLSLRWGLRPLVVMAQEVAELENGEREALSESYPRELQGLAGNLDRFVDNEKRSRSRYRTALEDLAHSLKTPLAVVRNALLEHQPDKMLLTEQLDRMEQTVGHQLSRASARGPLVVGKPLDVGQVIERLLRALAIAYKEKDLIVQQRLEAGVLVHGDESDFLEIFGNLLENAHKYTRSSIDVGMDVSDPGIVVLEISDDGPGIPEHDRLAVMNRGKRLDEVAPGQGIGLAVVADLVELYGGQLSIATSDMGGAKLLVSLPRR